MCDAFRFPLSIATNLVLPMRIPSLRLLPALATLLAASAVRGASSLSLSEVSTVTRSSSSAVEISGITWAGGNLYYAVDDNDKKLYPLTIVISETGSISSHSVGEGTSVSGAGDMEGCAWDPARGTIWISDETGAKIREFGTDGSLSRTAPVPSKQTQYYSNFSLEALSISGDGLSMWTVNEEALKTDGTNSTKSAGSPVRLTRFTRSSVYDNWTPDGEWAYMTEPVGSNPIVYNNDVKSRSGVAGLCALPDGSLLVLERNLSGSSILSCMFYTKVYHVDVSGETDISTLPSLRGYEDLAVSKNLLFHKDSIWVNYEGICLGPRLANGSTTVLLIADGGGTGSPNPNIMSLRLSGLDISTVTYTGPAGAEPVGGPYRYVAGSTVAATLPTAGDPYESQLRAHANWSSGGSTGDGSTASFTAPAGDSTFAWSFSTNNALPLLATDSFERNPVAAEADDIANWSGDGWVAEETYSAPASGYPLPLEAHTRVLAVDGDVERDYADAPGNGSRLDADVRVTRATADSPVAEVATPLQVALYFDEQGRPTLQHMAANGSARTVTTLSQTSYENGSWVRVGFAFDYTTGASGTGWCQVSINGTPCSTSAGVAAPSRTNASGSWYRVIGSGATKVSSLTLKGSGAVDDVALYDDEPAPVNVPATVFWVGGTP